MPHEICGVASGTCTAPPASTTAVDCFPEPWPRHLDTKPRHRLDASTPHMPTRPTRHPSTPLDPPRHHLGWDHARPCQGAKLDTSTPLDTARHRSTHSTPLISSRRPPSGSLLALLTAKLYTPPPPGRRASRRREPAEAALAAPDGGGVGRGGAVGGCRCRGCRGCPR